MQFVMHDLKRTLGQFKPLMNPEHAHIHALAAATGALPGQAGDNFIRRQQGLLGALMIGAGFLDCRWRTCLWLFSGSGFLFGRLKRAVLGRRLVGIAGIAIQRFLQSENLLLKRKVFLPQFVHQLDQTLDFGQGVRKAFLKR